MNSTKGLCNDIYKYLFLQVILLVFAYEGSSNTVRGYLVSPFHSPYRPTHFIKNISFISSPFFTPFIKHKFCLTINQKYILEQLVYIFELKLGQQRSNINITSPIRVRFIHLKQVRATSHTRPRARDHCTSSTLIGGKGTAGPKFAPSHYARGADGVRECKMEVEFTWTSTCHQMDHVSWSLELLSKTTSWRQA